MSKKVKKKNLSISATCFPCIFFFLTTSPSPPFPNLKPSAFYTLSQPKLYENLIIHSSTYPYATYTI